MVQHFIVIGNPIAHSKSPAIHQAFAKQVGLDIAYARQFCPDDADSFRAVVDAFFHGGGVGANVTVPFKQVAYAMCAENGELSRHAQVAGAVNTLMMRKGKLYGDNTDGQGLVNHLQQLGWQLDGKKVAIIGAGGASRGVLLPLAEAGVAEMTIANRTVSKADELVQAIQPVLPATASMSSCGIDQLTGQFDLIINATSIGLTGEALPLSEALSTAHAYDMMYGRALPFLQHFAEQGASVSEGFGMLVGQASLSFEAWTGKAVDTTQAMHDLQSSL